MLTWHNYRNRITIKEVLSPLSFKESYEFKHLVDDGKKCMKILNTIYVYIDSVEDFYIYIYMNTRLMMIKNA